MQSLVISALLAVLSASAGAQGSVKKAEGTFKTEEQKVVYTLGVAIARNVEQFELSPADSKFLIMGLRDALAGQPLQVDINAYAPKIQELQQKKQAAKAEKEKKKAESYLQKATKEKGAQVFPSGLVYTELRAGTGPSPAAADTIKAHYQGALTDGTVFDSSYQRGSPTQFLLNGVIPCWTEGIQKMKVGGKARLVCPSKIAYGDGGNPPRIPGGATLVFDVELVEIVGK